MGVTGEADLLGTVIAIDGTYEKSHVRDDVMLTPAGCEEDDVLT